MTKQSSESTVNLPPDYEEIKIEDQSMTKQSSESTAKLPPDNKEIKIEDRSMTKQSSANLPPDYELDDYWMQQVVLKDEETELYSAYAYFSSLYPLPEYVVKRAAAAPPYYWYKHHPSSNYAESVASQKKKKKNGNEKENNIKDQGFLNNKQSSSLFLKKRSNTHSWLFNKETTAAASPTATPHHIEEEEDQNQLQNNHHQDRSRKSTTPKILSLPQVPAANQEPNEELINRLITAKMGCCHRLMLVYQKNLLPSDVDHGQNRLSIPFGKILNNFLSSEEEILLQIQDQQNRRDFGVKLLIFNIHYKQQPCLEVEENKVYNINLVRLGKNYAMNGRNWYSLIVQQHKLEEHMPVQLWSFREHSQLCFALVKIYD